MKKEVNKIEEKKLKETDIHIEKKSSLLADMMKCPKCGFETRYDFIFLQFKEYAGKYCMKCLAKLLSENVPKMKSIENNEGILGKYPNNG